jgi:hypothetical protein
LASAALYLHGYHKPSSHPDLATSLFHPWQAAGHFFSLLGNPLGIRSFVLVRGWSSTHAVVLRTAVGFALFILFAFLTWTVRKDFGLMRRIAGWWSLGAYSIATAMLITIGRAGFGLEQSSTHRYTTFTLYLPVALICLLAIIVERRVPKLAPNRKWKLILAGVFLVSQLLALPSSVAGMKSVSSGLWHGKACLLFINVIEDESLPKFVYPHVEKLRRAANVLNNMGYLRPGLLRTGRVQDIAAPSANLPASYGSFNVVRASENEYVVSGTGDAAGTWRTGARRLTDLRQSRRGICRFCSRRD